MFLNPIEDDERAGGKVHAALGAIRVKVRFDAVSETAKRRFEPGRLVRICGGTFAGVAGAVLETRANFRSIVALRVSQAGVSLEVDDALLEAIE